MKPAAFSPSTDLVRILDRVDWAFRDVVAQKSIHSIHWFPGNFIPQLPSYFVELLSSPGETVIDPFCGSGTTGVEAVKLNRIAVQTDINRVCLLIARAKLIALTTPRVAERLESIVNHLVWDQLHRTDRLGWKDEGSNPELLRWFHPDTLGQLRYLWRSVEEAEQPIRDVLLAIFSDTLFASASPGRARTTTGRIRRHHWGWIADNVRPRTPHPNNAIALFRERALRMIQILRQARGPVTSRWEVVRTDVRRLALRDEAADLVVTSPPYLGMIDYARGNRLTYLWMNWSLSFDRDAEIGSRHRRRRATIESEYRDEIEPAAGEVGRILRPGRYCVLIIGSSRRYPEGVRTAISAFSTHLDLVWGPTLRTPLGRRVSDQQGRPSSESICLFQKKGA